jgi:heme oxygenase
MVRLKNQTQTYHEQVEAALDLPSRIVSLSNYEKLLASFYGIYRPLESRLAAMPRPAELGIDFSARWKTPSLVADLHSLGWRTDRIGALPLCRELPKLNSPAQVAGCAYVLEGATLGGQIIRGEIARVLNLRDAGVCFFTGYGKQTRSQWSAFGTAIDNYVRQNPSSADAVVRAAEETFTCLQRWLVGADR